MFKKDIDSILLKYFEDSLTSEELVFLEKWIEDNQEEYLNVVKLHFSSLESKQEVDADLAYQKFKRKINEDREVVVSKSKLVYSFLKYAAIFVGIAVSSFLIYQNNFKQDSGFFDAKNGVYDKATLILEDGSEVVLEEHQNEEIKSSGGVKISNNNKVLKYSAVGNKLNQNHGKVTYNTLHVPNGGIYQLELPDGTIVWLNSATSLKFPTQFIGKERVVSVDGEAYFEVEKDKKRPFIVKTQFADIAVLGTHFNVSSYDEDDFFSTALLEGSVRLKAINKSVANVTLKPGQKGNLIKDGDSPISVKTVDVNQEIAWKEGQFFFKKETLGAIIKKLSRWYKVDFKLDDKSIAYFTFTGVAQKEQPVEYLLDIISNTSKVKYEVIKKTKEGRKRIVIKKK